MSKRDPCPQVHTLEASPASRGVGQAKGMHPYAIRSLESKSNGTLRARKVCGVLWSSLGIHMAMLYWSRELPSSVQVQGVGVYMPLLLGRSVTDMF